jgi:uncharacterized protein with HEPN domain
MNGDDLIRLRHMLNAAREAVSLAQGATRESLETDRKLTLALIAEITIIGEAGSRLKKELQAAHPEISWAAVVGMRNVLVHAYFKIDLDIVWEALTKDLPELIAKLETIIPSDSDLSEHPKLVRLRLDCLSSPRQCRHTPVNVILRIMMGRIIVRLRRGDGRFYTPKRRPYGNPCRSYSGRP